MHSFLMEHGLALGAVPPARPAPRTACGDPLDCPSCWSCCPCCPAHLSLGGGHLALLPPPPLSSSALPSLADHHLAGLRPQHPGPRGLRAARGPLQGLRPHRGPHGVQRVLHGRLPLRPHHGPPTGEAAGRQLPGAARPAPAAPAGRLLQPLEAPRGRCARPPAAPPSPRRRRTRQGSVFTGGERVRTLWKPEPGDRHASPSHLGRGRGAAGAPAPACWAEVAIHAAPCRWRHRAVPSSRGHAQRG